MGDLEGLVGARITTKTPRHEEDKNYDLCAFLVE